MANGSIILDAMGREVLDADGKLMIDDGSGACCVKQLRDCSSGAFVAIYIGKALIPNPAVDYYVLRASDSTCYKVLASDPFVAKCYGQTDVGTVTSVTSCADSACGGGTPTAHPGNCPNVPVGPGCLACPATYLITTNMPACAVAFHGATATVSRSAFDNCTYGSSTRGCDGVHIYYEVACDDQSAGLIGYVPPGGPCSPGLNYTVPAGYSVWTITMCDQSALWTYFAFSASASCPYLGTYTLLGPNSAGAGGSCPPDLTGCTGVPAPTTMVLS